MIVFCMADVQNISLIETRIGYRGGLEHTWDFAERHSFRLSSPNYARILNSELKPTPV